MIKYITTIACSPLKLKVLFNFLPEIQMQLAIMCFPLLNLTALMYECPWSGRGKRSRSWRPLYNFYSLFHTLT